MKVQAHRKRRSASIQYTVRGVPPEVDRALRHKAEQRNKSLNEVVLEELSEAALGQKRRADFSDVTGGWTPDAAFDQILASQRRIDWDKWK